MVAERSDDAAGGDPEPRLDHAAEHHAEPECAAACAIRTASRMPPDGELDVDPVRDLGTSGDVAQPVAVLVDVDRDRRARLERRAAFVAGSRAAARNRRHRAPRACGSASSASSSDQASLTSTWSGSSVTPRTARTRSTSSPSRAPSFSFRRWNRAAARSARRAMSSGSPSQTVQEVGGPVRGSPSSCRTGRPTSFPCRSWRAASRPRVRRSRPREACLDLRERDGSSPRRVRAPRGRRAPLTPTRRSARSEPPRRTPTRRAGLDLDDVCLVTGLARDHERLRQPQRRDPGRHLHRPEPNRAAVPRHRPTQGENR